MREPSATLLRYINERDVVHLGARLLPLIGSYGSDPALSESRSPKPAAPVFLLHGVDDNVIPSIESEYWPTTCVPRSRSGCSSSGLISHAEADRPMHVERHRAARDASGATCSLDRSELYHGGHGQNGATLFFFTRKSVVPRFVSVTTVV